MCAIGNGVVSNQQDWKIHKSGLKSLGLQITSFLSGEGLVYTIRVGDIKYHCSEKKLKDRDATIANLHSKGGLSVEDKAKVAAAAFKAKCDSGKAFKPARLLSAMVNGGQAKQAANVLNQMLKLKDKIKQDRYDDVAKILSAMAKGSAPDAKTGKTVQCGSASDAAKILFAMNSDNKGSTDTSTKIENVVDNIFDQIKTEDEDVYNRIMVAFYIQNADFKSAAEILMQIAGDDNPEPAANIFTEIYNADNSNAAELVKVMLQEKIKSGQHDSFFAMAAIFDNIDANIAYNAFNDAVASASKIDDENVNNDTFNKIAADWLWHIGTTNVSVAAKILLKMTEDDSAYANPSVAGEILENIVDIDIDCAANIVANIICCEDNIHVAKDLIERIGEERAAQIFGYIGKNSSFYDLGTVSKLLANIVSSNQNKSAIITDMLNDMINDGKTNTASTIITQIAQKAPNIIGNIFNNMVKCGNVSSISKVIIEMHKDENSSKCVSDILVAMLNNSQENSVEKINKEFEKSLTRNDYNICKSFSAMVGRAKEKANAEKLKTESVVNTKIDENNSVTVTQNNDPVGSVDDAEIEKSEESRN